MPRKILHVTASLDRSSIGATSTLAALASEQTRQGHQVRIIAAWRKNDDVTWAERLRSRGIVVELIGPVKGNLGYNRSIRPMVGRHIADAEIIHLHGVFSETLFQTARIAHSKNKPFIWHPENQLTPEQWSSNLWRRFMPYHLRLKKVLQQATLLHFGSKFEAETAASLRLTTSRIIDSVGIALSPDAEIPGPGTFRRSLGIDQNSPLIVVTGNISVDSGVTTLIDVLGQIRSTSQKVYLALCGSISAQTRTTFEELAKKLDMSERLLFAPLLVGPQKLAAFRDASFAAFPWRNDIDSIDTLECLSMGTPVLLTNGCALHHEAMDYRFGGVSSLYRKDMGREIVRLLNSTSVRNEMTENAKTYINQIANITNVVGRWSSIYDQILGNKAISNPDPIGDRTLPTNAAA